MREAPAEFTLYHILEGHNFRRGEYSIGSVARQVALHKMWIALKRRSRDRIALLPDKLSSSITRNGKSLSQ